VATGQQLGLARLELRPTQLTGIRLTGKERVLTVSLGRAAPASVGRDGELPRLEIFGRHTNQSL